MGRFRMLRCGILPQCPAGGGRASDAGGDAAHAAERAGRCLEDGAPASMSSEKRLRPNTGTAASPARSVRRSWRQRRQPVIHQLGAVGVTVAQLGMDAVERDEQLAADLQSPQQPAQAVAGFGVAGRAQVRWQRMMSKGSSGSGSSLSASPTVGRCSMFGFSCGVWSVNQQHPAAGGGHAQRPGSAPTPVFITVTASPLRCRRAISSEPIGRVRKLVWGCRCATPFADDSIVLHRAEEHNRRMPAQGRQRRPMLFVNHSIPASPAN